MTPRGPFWCTARTRRGSAPVSIWTWSKASQAGENATIGYPEIDLGIIPAIHFVLLPKIIGRHRAFELLFGGKPFPAARAEALGLVNRVVPADTVLDEARALAREMAGKARSVMRFGRNAFHRANALDLHRSIEDVADALAAVADLPEALAAFAEKRKPVCSCLSDSGLLRRLGQRWVEHREDLRRDEDMGLHHVDPLGLAAQCIHRAREADPVE